MTNFPNKILAYLLAAFILGFSNAPVFAASTGFDQCLQVFANNTPPVVQNHSDLKPRALCFSGFAVLHSGKSHTPIYSAERLNRQLLLNAKHKKRTNKFFADARLPRAERAELEDYRDSGLDRGHMAPAADMATEESMAQCFSLANMVPQAPINNRKTWAGIEKATRKYVMRAAGDVFVITGPAYDSAHATIGSNGVWIPQHLFKLVYDPSANRAWAYWVDNTDVARASKPIGYDELVRRTGIEFLPGFHGG